MNKKLFLASAVSLCCLFSASCQIENLPQANSNSNLNSNANSSAKNSPSSSQTPTAAPTTAVNTNTGNAATPPPAQPEPNPNTAVNSSANTNSEMIVVSKLIIPVEGKKKSDLRDTFTDARSEGRVHNALDIMAAQGSHVLAATDGQIVKFFDSERGGITIYQLSTDKRLVLYYAHLQSRAEGITEGMEVKKGTLIGYVGDTGNAGAGNYHLHFAMWVVTDPKRYWDGENLNPYQYLQ